MFGHLGVKLRKECSKKEVVLWTLKRVLTKGTKCAIIGVKVYTKL